MSRINFLSFWAFIFCSASLFAQEGKTDSIYLKTYDYKDSIRIQVAIPGRQVDRATVRQFSRLQTAHSTINSIDLYLNQLTDTGKITSELGHMEATIRLAKFALASADHHYVYRLLKGLSILLGEVSENLNEFERKVKNLSSRIRTNDSLINAFHNDSALLILPKDPETRDAYILEFQGLFNRLIRVDSANSKASIEFNHVLTRIIKELYEVEDLRRYLNYQLNDFNSRLFDKEEPPLLEASKKIYKHSFTEVTKLSFADGTKIASFYAQSNGLTFLGTLVLLLILHAWSRYVRRKYAAENAPSKKMHPITSTHGQFIPAIFLVWLTILPVFFTNMPMAVYSTITLLMALTITYIFWKMWPLEKWLYWLAFFLLFRGIAWFNIYLYSTVIERWFILLLQLASIGWCFAVLRYLRKHFKEQKEIFLLNSKLSSAIFFLTIAMQSAAIVANFSGRFALAKILSTAAVNGFFMAIVLGFFIATMLELISMQMDLFKQGKDPEIDQSIKQILHIFKRALIAFAVIVWLIIISRTLNFYDIVYDQVGSFLDAPRQVGKIVFTFGSLAIFFIIMWIATMLSVIISFFVDTGSVHVMKRSRFADFKLLIKLGIITCGVFLAFAASGIPIDKLTIVFGALSVGIGFGLQNLANNIVSGIVISFERPIRLGDTIEVNSQVGVVKEIGVRACKLYTDDGLDLIVPNGEILSKNITNWTLSSPSRRINFKLSVKLDTDTNLARSLIERIMEEEKLILKSPKTNVLMSSIENGAIMYNCNFWCANVKDAAMIKSKVLESISKSFKEKGIRFDDYKLDLHLESPKGAN